MTTDTYESIWNEVHGHSLSVDPLLVQSWVRDTWREVAEARSWSWLRKRGVIRVPAPYSTGTVDLSPGSTDATFSGATLDDTWIGRQFRVGSGTVYDITDVDATANVAQIFPTWSDTDADVTGQSYKIFTAYLNAPDSEFFAWISIKDPSRRRKLRLHVNQETLDYYDSPRAMSSLGPSCISGLDWSRSYVGRVFATQQVVGAGTKPIASGTYTGQTDSLFIVTITTGGAAGVGKFSWQKDTQTVHTNVDIAASVTMQDGVTLTFGTGTYTLNDVFVVRVSTRPQYGMPRYELYPHHTAALYLPCTYTTRVQAIDETGFVLPYTMRGDVIKTGALAKMARYPGTDARPNPFAQLARATFFEEKFQDQLGELCTADDYIMETNVLDDTDQWEYAMLPWVTMSGTGLRPTQEFDPLDLLI